MRTIAVVARKGGTGKTTVATHLAIAAFLRGRRAMLADMDPQRSAVTVLRARDQDGPQWAQTAGAKLFALQVSALRDKVDTLVIDTPAGEDCDLVNAIVVADLTVLVIRPTFLDLAALVSTTQIVQRLGKPSLIVLNQAPPMRAGGEPPAVRKAVRVLAYLGLEAAPVILRSRSIYQSALERGLSVEELRADAGAHREVVALDYLVSRLTTRPSNPQTASGRERSLTA